LLRSATEPLVGEPVAYREMVARPWARVLGGESWIRGLAGVVSDDISRLVWISVEFRNMFDLVNSN
jgi:hypothetical protein